MGFLKNLLFAEDSATKSGSNEPAQPSKNPQMETTPDAVSPMSRPTQPIMVGVADDRFVEMLESAIEAANIPGLDYLEFKQAVAKMSNLAIDEKTKFLSAYASFELQGCGKDTLVSSIDTYINVANNEKEMFNNELANKLKTDVTDKRSQIEKNQESITRLNEQILSLNTENVKLSQEANQSEMELKMVESNFNQSVASVIAKMESDKQKLITYIA